MLDTFTADIDQVAQRLRRIRLVPVVELPTAEVAVPLVDALVGSGLDCVEITFRTSAARDGITAVREAFPDVLLAAGTVLSVEQLDAAADLGVDLVVSPGTNPALVEAARKRALAFIPGVCTPSEIELARAHGLRVLKFFPAEAIGGADFLKALCGPYRDMSFVPTGGIGPDNLLDYLRLPQVIACGGSWIVKPETLVARDFDTVRRLVEDALAVALAAG